MLSINVSMTLKLHKKESMAKLEISEVEHIAKLSKLELTNEESKEFQRELSSILDYVEQLGSVNTDKVAPTANITGLFNAMREDKVLDSQIKKEDIKKNAPSFQGDNFVVPGVFE